MGGGKPCIQCFEAGTKVQTAKGLKPIEQIKEGDRVLSYNEQTGRNEYQAVTQTFTRYATDVWELKVAGETKPIGVTSEHPFFVRVHGARSHTSTEGEWRETWQIRPGDQIRLASGRWARVISVLPKGEGRVYNFTVEQNHNYFVGRTRLLTHNACPDFLGQANGPAIPVPKGSTPTPVINKGGKTTGFGFKDGAGGNGLAPKVDTVRIMDPTLPNGPSPGYPNGDVTYMKGGQTVNPYTGQTVPKSSPWWHIPLN